MSTLDVALLRLHAAVDGGSHSIEVPYDFSRYLRAPATVSKIGFVARVDFARDSRLPRSHVVQFVCGWGDVSSGMQTFRRRDIGWMPARDEFLDDEVRIFDRANVQFAEELIPDRLRHFSTRSDYRRIGIDAASTMLERVSSIRDSQLPAGPIVRAREAVQTILPGTVVGVRYLRGVYRMGSGQLVQRLVSA